MMNAQKQNRSFENRCKGLKKKLGELSTLCDVEVCMVCTRPSSSQLHVWPEDPSKVEHTISKYRMMMKSCGKTKKKVPHYSVDINGSGRKKEVPVSDEHLNFPGKEGKTKDEIYLESLPYEKLKEFMSTLNGKIEEVKTEIAVKKMQAELMELITDPLPPTSMGENKAASPSTSSYGHQNITGSVPPMQGRMWMRAPQNHLMAVPPMKQMMRIPRNHLTADPSMQETAYMLPQPHLAAVPPIQNIMRVPRNHLTAAISAMPEMMLMSQNHRHVTYGNYSSNQYARDADAFNF